MKMAPFLHPRDLLSKVSRILLPTKDVPAKLKAHLVSEDGAVEILLAVDGSCQIQMNPAATKEMRLAMNRLLNTWDHESPRWFWQLDALLDPVARDISGMLGAENGQG